MEAIGRFMMGETCKTCRGKFDFGIWISPQFRDEKVLLFCSKKCKGKYLKMKLERIKVNYPKYYERIMKSLKSEKKDNPFWLKKEKKENE